MHSDSGSGLADETKQLPCLCHLAYRRGQPASYAKLFVGQELAKELSNTEKLKCSMYNVALSDISLLWQEKS